MSTKLPVGQLSTAPQHVDEGQLGEPGMPLGPVPRSVVTPTMLRQPTAFPSLLNHSRTHPQLRVVQSLVAGPGTDLEGEILDGKKEVRR